MTTHSSEGAFSSSQLRKLLAERAFSPKPIAKVVGLNSNFKNQKKYLTKDIQVLVICITLYFKVL